MRNQGTTLISMVGTGLFEESKTGEGNYRETVYRFPDGTKSESVSLFVKALLAKKDLSITSVILIGTNTSSWDALVPDKTGKQFELWSRLNEECSTKMSGITEKDAHSLENCLKEEYGIPFTVLHHDDVLDEENTEKVMRLYATVKQYVPDDTKLLIDITHGFRTMPLMLFQSLQLYSSAFEPDDVTVVYGEYRKEIKEAAVRFYSNLWKLSEIQKRIYAFKSTFDGGELADSLDVLEEQSNLAKWVRNFSDMVKKNYVLQIGTSMRQLKNILQKNNKESHPAWMVDVVLFLQDLGKRLEIQRTSEQLRVFGEILFEHGLITQAIISLRVAVETRIDEIASQPIGDYSFWDASGHGTELLHDACLGDERLWKTLESLRVLRNSIAHAGGDRYTLAPQAERIPFDEYDKAIIQLFEKKGMS